MESNTGRITFAKLMEEALYGKIGFYKGQVTIGKSGHSFNTFATEDFFQMAMTIQLIEMWEKLGFPKKFTVIEMGAGTGIMAAHILNKIKKNVPELYRAIDYVIVDDSEYLKQKQRQKIKIVHGSLGAIRWVKGTATDLSQLRNVEGVFLSNELPDAFPVHRVKFVKGKPYEVYARLKDGRFNEELGELSSKELSGYIDDLDTSSFEDGVEIPVNLNAHQWQREMSKALKRGFVLTVDYGGKMQEIIEHIRMSRRGRESVYNQKFPSMEAIYENIGAIDLTSRVDFYGLKKAGEEAGLDLVGYISQHEFLNNLLKGFASKDQNKEMRSFQVMVQAKNVKEIELKGLKKREIDSKIEYNSQAINVNLPIKLKSTKFIVVSDLVSAPPRKIFDMSFDAADQLLLSKNTYKKIRLHDNQRYKHPSGNYVIYPKRTQLKKGMRIWNSKGKLLITIPRLKDETNYLYPEEIAIEFDEYNRRYHVNYNLNTTSTIFPYRLTWDNRKKRMVFDTRDWYKWNEESEKMKSGDTTLNYYQSA